MRLAAGQTIISGKPIVLDGDTLLFGQTEVDLWGIDAPEMSDWPLGAYARAALDQLIGGDGVRCRGLRNVGGHDAKVGGCAVFKELGEDDLKHVILGQAMLASGWAVVDRPVLPSASSVTADLYNNLSAEARGAGRGIWANPILPPKRLP